MFPQPPFPVRANFGNTADEEDDLAFAPGQRITVDEVLDTEWFHGYYVDTESGNHLDGIFPISYVEVEKPPSRPTKAHHPKSTGVATPVATPTPSAAPAAVPAATGTSNSQSEDTSIKSALASNEVKSTPSASSVQPATSVPAAPSAHSTINRFKEEQEDEDDWDDNEDDWDQEEKKISFGKPKTNVPPELEAQVAA